MDLAVIDNLLLSSTTDQWRKVAMVVAIAMNKPELTDMDDTFLAARIASLVDAGRIQARGDINLMRLSEIRLPQH